MPRFRAVGRVAFARGNSAWARGFNQRLNKNFNTGIAPQTWRMLSEASSLNLSKFSTFALAAELPVGPGFAEQFSDMSAHAVGARSESSVSEEASEESDVAATVEAVNEINIQSCCGSPKTCWLSGYVKQMDCGRRI
jgi:hypothetical protein